MRLLLTLVICFLLGLLGVRASAAVTPIVESFDGGFDEPWGSNIGGVFTDTGLRFDLSGRDGLELKRFYRETFGQGGFDFWLDIKDLSFSEVQEFGEPGSRGEISVWIVLDDARVGVDDGVLNFTLNERNDDLSEWEFTARSFPQGSPHTSRQSIQASSDVSLGIRFDAERMETTFLYGMGVQPPEILSVLPYEGLVGSNMSLDLRFDVSAHGSGGIGVLLDNLSLQPHLLLGGDFDGNGILGTKDIEVLIAAVQANNSLDKFDVNSDAVVDQDDVRSWVHDLADTYFGDANIDGEFASSDLVFIFGAGEYEDDVPLNSTWATGDWNGDGDFTSSDIVLAFEDGGYEQGPRAAVVPEPSSLTLAGLGLVLVGSRLGRRK